MSYRTFSLCAAIGIAALAMTVQVPAQDGTFHFTELIDPQAIPPSFTAGHGINDLGVIAGSYQGADGVFYGFVSTPPYSKSSYTNLAGLGAGPIIQGNPWVINLEGVVAGYYVDADDIVHGMVSRPPYTVVTTVDAPGACEDSVPECIGTQNGTAGWNINLEGVIAANYSGADSVAHGYVTYPPYGKTDFTSFDAPGACSSGSACAGLGTFVPSKAFNDFDTVTGYYFDANQVAHGFVGYPPYGKTNFTTADAPGACEDDVPSCPGSYNGTYPDSINLWGVITGTYYDAYSVGHGFVSYPPYTKSAFISFDAPGACSSDSSPACFDSGTFPGAINLEGVITGYFQDSNGVYHGFVIDPPYGKTNFTTFDAPGACSSGSACAYSGTNVFDINLEGSITGVAVDASGAYHGFVAQREWHGY